MIAQIPSDTIIQQVLTWERTAPGAFIAAVLLIGLVIFWKYIVKPAIELGAKLGNKKRDEE